VYDQSSNLKRIGRAGHYETDFRYWVLFTWNLTEAQETLRTLDMSEWIWSHLDLDNPPADVVMMRRQEDALFLAQSLSCAWVIDREDGRLIYEPPSKNN